MKNSCLFVSKNFNGWFIFQFIAMITATFNVMCNGLFVGWPTPSLPQLLKENSTIPTTDNEGSWIATMYLLGGVCGALLSAVIIDRFGRKLVILLTSLPFFVGWIMTAFAKSATFLLIARFIAGISEGLLFCSVPIYLAEIAEPKIRGFIGSSILVTNLLGIFLVNIIGSYLSIETTALICSVVPVLLLVTFVWMPESPYYLIMKGNLEQAKKSLTYFRRQEVVDEELKRLTAAVEEQHRNAGGYLDLFTVKSNRKAVYIVIGTRFGQQFSGATAIMFYAQIIFEEIGYGVSSKTASMIYMGVQLVVSSICTVFVDKIGRRPLLIISLMGVILTLLTEACYFYVKDETAIDVSRFSLIPVITLFLYVVMYCTGLYTIPLLLISEIFPTNVKASAVSLADVYFCIISTVAVKCFQLTKDNFGLYISFVISCICDILTVIFVIMFVPETKGKTLEEVQEELKGGRKRIKQQTLRVYDTKL